MRRVRYCVAVSLDGFIAGPKGEADWIMMDPEIDFKALFEQFDTFLIGRRTFEPMARARKSKTPGVKTFVFSRTLRQEDYPGVTIVAEGWRKRWRPCARSRGRIFGYSAVVHSFAVSSTPGW